MELCETLIQLVQIIIVDHLLLNVVAELKKVSDCLYHFCQHKPFYSWEVDLDMWPIRLKFM